MERFPVHLDMRKLEGFNWQLRQDFVFISPTWGTLVVPRGFVTDLASVPWFARWYVSRDGDHLKAAVIHDYAYAKDSILAPISRGQWGRLDRRAADRLFLEAMKVRGVRPAKAQVIYAAVRLGGGRSFRRAETVGLRLSPGAE